MNEQCTRADTSFHFTLGFNPLPCLAASGRLERLRKLAGAHGKLLCSAFSGSTMNSAVAAALVVAFFVLTYTAYDKTLKRLDVQQLVNVLALRKGWHHSLGEVNKVLALAGLPLLVAKHVPFVPQALSDGGSGLFDAGLSLLLVHSALSVVLFAPRQQWWPALHRPLQEAAATALGKATTKQRMEALRVLSVIVGHAALAVAVLVSVTILPWADALASTASALGVFHFLTMEVDFRGTLQVRPAAYVSLLPAVAQLLQVSWTVLQSAR